MDFTSDELRILALAGPVLISMLKRREERIVSRIYGEFRNGKTEHISALAEMACVRDQINEITNAIRQMKQLPPEGDSNADTE